MRLFSLFISFYIFLLGQIASAKDLESIAQAGQAKFMSIGMASLGIGFTIGAILFGLGIAHIGRLIMISGAVGSVALLGFPAFLGLLKSIFL